MQMTVTQSRWLGEGPGKVDPMDATHVLRRHCDDKLRRRWPGISWIIKTRNSPCSAHVTDFQTLLQTRKVNVYRDVIQCLDLACTFKGLSIENLSEDKKQTSMSPNIDQAFEQPSGNPSSTTTEERRGCAWFNTCFGGCVYAWWQLY